MLGEEAVLVGQHGVDGMAQFVRHGGHIIGAALVIEQHPGGQVRDELSAESAAAFALAHFAVEVAVVKDTLRPVRPSADQTG